MKKIYFWSLTCLLFMACSVDNEDLNLEQGLVMNTSDLQSTVVDDSDPCSPAIFVELCTDDIENPTLQGFTNFFKNQIRLNTDLPDSGSFSPSMADLLSEYQEAGGIGTFTSTYTVDTQSCGTVTSQVSVTTSDCQSTEEPVCPGDISNQLCASEIQNPTVQGFTNYYKNLIFANTDETIITGSFSPTMAELVNEYNQAGGFGTFSTNYTYQDASCGEITIEVAVTVSDCTVVGTPPCVENISAQLCSSEINNPTVRGFTNYYKNLIFANTNETIITGSFNPTMAELVNEFNQAGGLGTFTTNYTYVDATCGEITIEVAATVADCTIVETPPCVDDIFVELCDSEIDNPTLQGFRNYYRNLIFLNTNETRITGTFNPSLADLYNQFQQEGQIGTFSTNYTVNLGGDCGEVTFEVAARVNDCD